MQNHKDSVLPIPQGKYVPANRYGQLIFSAGMTPRINGVLQFSGKVLKSAPLSDYKKAVEIAAANALIAVKSLLQPQEQIVKVLTLTVYINAEDGYTEHSKIADFASDLLCAQLGEAGIVSRTAIGVASLPGNAPVEVQLIVAAAGK